ncbi:MAG: glycosyltransferase family 2 protein [Planctomycetota bacterium]
MSARSSEGTASEAGGEEQRVVSLPRSVEPMLESGRELRTASGVRLTGCVISFQESDRIAECVHSLDFCDEIVVVDSGSTDGTAELAAEAGARVFRQVPFLGHREQKQRAVDLATHDWVMCLDADERITPALRARLIQLKQEGFQGSGYNMPRENHYLGRVLKRGIAWPDRKIRLFDRRKGHWGGTNPHDRVELDGSVEPTRLEESFQHLSFRDLRQHVRTADNFARISAKALFDQGRRTRPWDLLLRPPAMLLKSLVLKAGIVDGWRGVAVAGLASWNNWLKYWRLYRLGRQAGRRPT